MFPSEKKIENSHQYYQLLCNRFSQELNSKKFNISNETTPNQSTTSFFPTYNFLFVIEKEIRQNSSNFFLWGLSLEPTDGLLKREPMCKRFSISLSNENNQDFETTKDFSLQILDNANFFEDYLILFGGPHIFVAKIDDFMDTLESSELNFQIIGSSLDDRNILKVKWVPFAADHIGVLYDDNTFMIYDFGNNIDEAELTLDLTSLDPKKRLVSEIPPLFEDFTFSQNKDAYDCSMFSVFFMNNYGEIYYKCPIIINGMNIPKKMLVFLRKRIDHEKKANVVDKELIDRIQGFIKSIEDFSSEDENCYGNLQIKSSKIPQNINVNEGPLQGPVKVFDNDEEVRNNYRVVFKIPNTFNHIFARINQEGLISILLSSLNIWPSPVQNPKENLKNKCIPSDFQLVTIDKIMMCSESKLQKRNNKNKENDQLARNAFSPILFHQIYIKNIFYVLFFNQFFEINIDWIDEIENCFFTTNIEEVYAKSISHPNIRLVFDNPRSCDKMELKDLAEACYYGCALANDCVVIFRTPGQKTLIDIVGLNAYKLEQNLKKKIEKGIFPTTNKFEESKITKTPINFDKDIELPAILDVELLKDTTEEDKNENIKRISEYFLKIKQNFSELEKKLQSKFRNNQKMYLEIVCQKEEIEQLAKKLENDDLKCQSMESKIVENQAKIEDQIETILEMTSKRSLAYIPNLSALKDQTYDLAGRISVLSSKTEEIKKKFINQISMKNSLIDKKLEEKDATIVNEIIQANKELKKKLDKIENKIKKANLS